MCVCCKSAAVLHETEAVNQQPSAKITQTGAFLPSPAAPESFGNRGCKTIRMGAMSRLEIHAHLIAPSVYSTPKVLWSGALLPLVALKFAHNSSLSAGDVICRFVSVN